MIKIRSFFEKLAKSTVCIVIFTGLLCFACTSAGEDIEPSSPAKIQQYWFDGAEIARYALTQSRYGEEHPGSAELVFVTEPFLTDQHVKHEGGPGPATPVLKLNALRSFNTGLYTYRTMLSVFAPTDIKTWPHALKATTSVQDWCGQIFQQLNLRSNAWHGQQFSYFQNEGDQAFTLPATWIEDEIWTRLRLDPYTLPTGSIQMIPGSLFLRFKHLPHAVYSAHARLDTREEHAVYTLTYPKLGRTLIIEFNKAFPYVIQGWTESQADDPATTRARLTHRIEHSYYWSLNRPQNARLRKQLGLEP